MWNITVDKTWKTDQKKKLQQILNRYGFTDGNGGSLAVDGVFGPKSMQAIEKMKTYQQHLTNPDPETRAMQEHLSGMGFKNADGTSLKVDGIYGPKTDAANNDYENTFLDGLTGGTNQKKTVQTKTFPNMPKASGSQIKASVMPTDTNPNGYDTWGQRHAYIGKTVLQQMQDEQYKTNYGTGAVNANYQTNASEKIVQPPPAAPAVTKVNNNGGNGTSMYDYKKSIFDSGYYSINDPVTQNAVKKALNMSQYDTLPDVVQRLKDYLNSKGDDFDETTYNLTRKNLDTLFEEGSMASVNTKDQSQKINKEHNQEVIDNIATANAAQKASGQTFDFEVDAAKYFYSNGAMSDTANNKVERSCIIIPVTLQVTDEYGNLTNQTKYKIVGNFTGDYHFIGMEALAAAAALRARGIDCSVVHTHPAVQGQDDEHFSGLGSFGTDDWIGDYMLNWLGGVKNVYMANEKSNKIYVSDKRGPEMDPQYPGQYKPVGQY